MTDKEITQLLKLLNQLKEEKLVPPQMPFEVWKSLKGLVAQPAVEVLITRTGKDFLLVERHDDYWNGWHIPGGFMAAEEKIPDALNRHANKELGTDVELVKILFARTWPNHPYASAVSIVCVCKALKPPKKGKFFTQIPPDIIPEQKEFLEKFLDEKL